MADDTKLPANVGDPSQDDGETIIDADHIANLLHAKGPVVKCVVLRAPKRNGDEDKKPAAANDPNTSTSFNEDLIEELEIDTTPQKNEVEKILGGPITFIGQYDEGEGIVLMAQRGMVEQLVEEGKEEEAKDFAKMKISQLRAQCVEWDVNMDNMVEKSDLVEALKAKEDSLPVINPHKLQPPLDNVRVRGDILILKVKEIDDNSVEEEEEEVAEEEGAKDDKTEDAKLQQSEEKEAEDGRSSQEVASASANKDDNNNDSTDFFLPYTKEEYIKFAARTDIVAKPLKQAPGNGNHTDEADDSGEDNNEDEDDYDENDGDFNPGEEEMTEEEEKSAMLNIVMSELLRKFRSDNGRGPDSQEVLLLRASVAEQIGMEVATYDEEAEQEAAVNGKKRAAENSDGSPRKRVKFDSSVVSSEEAENEGESAADGEDDRKPAAKETSAEESELSNATKEEEASTESG